MTRNQYSRRVVLASTGLGAVSGIAGCSGALSSQETDGTDGGNSDGPPEYTDWLGPKTADVHWEIRPEDGEVIDSTIVASPRDIRASGLSEEAQSTMLGELDAFETLTASFDGSLDDVTLAVWDEFATFQVLTGSFDGGTFQTTLEEVASARGEHQGMPVYVSEVTVPNSDETAHQGFAVDDGHFVHVRFAAEADAADQLVRGLLDTGLGDAERFLETNDRFAKGVDYLGSGVWGKLISIGAARFTGLLVDVDGDTATRVRAISPVGDTTPEELAERLRDGDQEAMDRTVTGETRSQDNRLVVYSDHEVSVDGDLVIEEGSLPTDAVAPVDLR